LALYDQLEKLWRQRLDVGPIGDMRVGHDRGRVGVDQHGRAALFAQGAASLRAGVVELGGLTDDNGAGADNQNFHRWTPASRRKSSKRGCESCGPGQPSGWYWTENTGSSRWRRPSTLP